MKLTTMKRILLLIAATAAVTLSAHAQEPAEDRWVKVATAATGEPIYIDSDTIEFPAAESVIYWRKVILKSGGSQITRLVMYLPTRQYRALSFVEYGSTGETLRTSDTPGSWTQVVPDSIGEKIYRTLLILAAAHQTPSRHGV